MMSISWQSIADTLRLELANYGGLLHLFEQQQKSLFARDANNVLELSTVIESETKGLAEARSLREKTVAEFASTHGMPPKSSLRELLPLMEAAVRPLIEALIGEVNRLLHKLRRISRSNHELLARTVELHQETLQQLRPESFTKTYSYAGRMSANLSPALSLRATG